MLLLPVTVVVVPKQVLLHPVVVLLGIEQLDNKLQPNARYNTPIQHCVMAWKILFNSVFATSTGSSCHGSCN